MVRASLLTPAVPTLRAVAQKNCSAAATYGWTAKKSGGLTLTCPYVALPLRNSELKGNPNTRSSFESVGMGVLPLRAATKICAMQYLHRGGAGWWFQRLLIWRAAYRVRAIISVPHDGRAASVRNIEGAGNALRRHAQQLLLRSGAPCSPT